MSKHVPHVKLKTVQYDISIRR